MLALSSVVSLEGEKVVGKKVRRASWFFMWPKWGNSGGFPLLRLVHRLPTWTSKALWNLHGCFKNFWKYCHYLLARLGPSIEIGVLLVQWKNVTPFCCRSLPHHRPSMLTPTKLEQQKDYATMVYDWQNECCCSAQSFLSRHSGSKCSRPDTRTQWACYPQRAAR